MRGSTCESRHASTGFDLEIEKKEHNVTIPLIDHEQSNGRRAGEKKTPAQCWRHEMADGDGNGQRWGHPSKKQRFRLLRLVWLFVAFVAVTVVS